MPSWVQPPGRRQWFSVEDTMFEHPRWQMLDGLELLAAAGMWTRLMADAHRLNRDGFVPSSQLKVSFGPHWRRISPLKSLMKIGMVEPDPSGVYLHDYCRHQPGRAERLARSEDARKLAHIRHHREHASTHENGDASTHTNGHAPTHEPEMRLRYAELELEEEEKPDPLSPPVENLARRRHRKPRGLTADEIRQMAHTPTQERTHP